MAESAWASTPTEQRGPSRPTRVLLVEDNPEEALLLEEVLSQVATVDFDLEHVTTLELAIERLSRERAIDVVLLDLGLPDAEGLEAVRRIHGTHPAAPIVVLTGLKDEALAIAAVREGAQDYLVKGEIGSNLLVRAIRYAMERERVEQALRQSEEQLRQAQKMEAVGRLAGGIAHDFNNFLTVITGRSQLLVEGLDAEDPLIRHARVIERTTERAAALTRQLLAFSRKQVVEPRILDLNAVLVGLHPMLRQLIGENIDFAIVARASTGQVRADPGQIEQVVLNLAVNARDAMPNGGRITIETDEVDLDESYTRWHVGVEPGPYVQISVSDNGTGMDAETRSRIFEPFFTTKERGKGTGLGLATVYGIVKQAGGNIWVYSEPGLGTIFKVYLPSVGRAVATGEEAPAPVAPRGSETILVVEDEAEVLELAREVLHMSGYAVLRAAQPAQAVEICRHHPAPIHLLLTDVVMPQMSGRALATKLSAMRPEMRVLYTSGYTDDAIVHHGVLDPEIAFLQKPYSPTGLARKVREVLDAPDPRGA